MDIPPKSRYTDTSYLIFQQLKEGGLQAAFPAIFELLNPGVKVRGSPDQLPAGVEPLSEVSKGSAGKIAGQYKAKDTRKSPASGIPRKQSKIAEKRKNRRSLELKVVEEVAREEEHEEDGVDGVLRDVAVEEQRRREELADERKLQICDISGGGPLGRDPRHVSVISSGDEQVQVQKDIQVPVDFHHRPNSEVESGRGSVVEVVEANNNDIRCKSLQVKVAGEVESDSESARTITPGLGTREEEIALAAKAPSVQIRRKQYLYEPCYLTGSEYSDTDLTDTASSVGELDDSASASGEYARVELRQKNNHEEEQQILNKYNSLPIHAIHNSGQQQSSASRPGSSLSQVTTTSNTNGNHYQHHQQQYHQHHYSLQPVHQQTQQQHQQHLNNGQQSQGTSAGPRLSYVTERILASILPVRRSRQNGISPAGSGGSVDEYERELIEMLEQKHEKNYRIFDLESCISSITLEKLCELCKHIDSWLGSGREKIVVLQDREDKQRLGAAIAAYLEYQKICGSNFPQSNRTKALSSPAGSEASGRRTPGSWLDLDIYSTQRFLDSVAGPLRIPSHRRYIKYFSGLLAGAIKMNSSPLYLRAFICESPPCLHYRAVTINSEWRSFIKIFEGVRCLFTSDIYVIPITTRQFIYEIKHPLRLRGDVLVRTYQIIPNNNKLHDEKELISAVQFHTCAITEKEVQFGKLQLDLACDDDRFPADHKVTLCFDTTPNERSAILVFQNPLVRIEPILENGDLLETINGDESSHTQGPLDGSLYATILKSPKSPTPGQHQQQILISPPAEFSNGKQQQQQLIPNGGGGSGAGPPPVTPPPRNVHSYSHVYESAKRYQSQNGVGPGSSSKSPGALSSVSESGSANISSGNLNLSNSNGNYRDVIQQQQHQQQQSRSASSGSGGGGAAGYDQNQNPIATHSQSNSTTQQQVRSQADGRESVRSPLTLSMDSGISSSGPVNRRPQGSPSSFPSQASPQDDRHRELDDLLSDMLMTVQGIPDVNRKNSELSHSQSHHHHQQQQQQQRSTHHQNLSDHFVNTNTDTIKRSHSSQLPVLREEQRPASSASVLHHSLTSGALSQKTERELLLCETSSTTTTLTPPPSESGRETPLLSSSAYSTIRDKRELGGALTPTERELIMSLQQHQQSFGYPRQARSTTGASERFTSDDDEDFRQQQQIPYHAREDSRPFTYGNIPLTGTPQNPPASTMIKMQSGLSSPSMVRKAFGTPTSVRKSGGGGGGGGGLGSGRNSEFEEMLRERREKVLSEKYTIGDQQSSPGGGGLSDSLNNNLLRGGTDTVDNRNWNNYQTTVRTITSEQNGNGYHYHEPLKRSNTMDGSFGRQFSNDGISGQTWLQLQQQKLRARKEQQKREHSNSFSYSYGSPAFPTGGEIYNGSATTQHRRSQTLSPVRNDRSYHTLSTTTSSTNRTHSTERPFVAVKRAHENAKMQSIGAREESFSSYRSETEPDNSPTGGSPRPETPAFPVTPRTPYGLSNGTSSPALPPKSPTSQRKDLFSGNRQEIINQNETVSCYTSRRNSTTSNANSEPQEVAPQFVKFARDSSKYWYKPSITREEAITLLRNAPPGTFVVRDSTTFANAYGLVVKVTHPPPGVPSKGPNSDELVRHFLVEPTIRGVRLKGCSNEPVFTSLSALVYQHSITPLALPCRLIIPDTDLQQTDFTSPAQQQLLTQGAACNVLYLFTCDTESLTGPQAIRKAVGSLLSLRPLPKPTQVHFKVSIQGITLTDNTRQLFFRRHYPSNNVSFCGLDPDEHRWSIPSSTGDIPASKRIFAFVAKRSPTSADNQCHVFCELESTQPATAIVSFANKVVLGGTTQQPAITRAI